MKSSQELICVVDDDPSVRRGLQRLFESAGYKAELFASADDYLAREKFDGSICLILDFWMPGMNGLELQRTLEARGSGEQIVFVTGHGDVSICVQAMRNGAVDFLMKPFDDAQLIACVESALVQARTLTGTERTASIVTAD